MKQIFSLFIAMFALVSSGFANSPEISKPVLNSFRQSFAQATEVAWTEGTEYYKATFQLYGKTVTAFYNAEGELMAVTRNMSVTELPIALQAELKAAAAGRWITEVFQVASLSSKHYFAVVENADNKQVLQSRSNKKWAVYQNAEKQ